MRKDAKSKETKLYPNTQRAGVLSIKDLEEGKTTLRVVKHERDTMPFVPFRSTWLEVEESIATLSRYNLDKIIKEQKLEKALGVKKVEDLKETPDEELRETLIEELGADFKLATNKRIFISKLHGNPEIPDVIEEYIKFANKMISDITQDQDERKAKRAPISGWKEKNGTWHPGIMPGTSYMCYVFPWELADREVKRFEMWDKNMDEVEKLYAAFDDPEEPLTVDPFSDPKEGVPLVFDKVKNDKQKFDIIISDKKAPRAMNFKDFVAKFALSDAEIAEVNEKPSLSEMYTNVYGRRDFELALNGLQLFDEKNEMGVFANDEFMSIVEAIAINYDDTEEKPTEKEEKLKVKVNKPVKDDLDVLNSKPGKVVEQEKKLKDKPAEKVSKVTRREELVQYIKDNELGIRVLPRHTDDEIAEMIQEVEEDNAKQNEAVDSGSDSNIPEPETEIVPDSVRETPKPKQEAAGSSVDKIAEFRKRMEEKKKTAGK
jgi:hypothetical protein